MNISNGSVPIDTYDYQKKEINLYYAVCEILVAVFAVVGNALVIFVFRKERRLRRRTNYYIVSLAAADFLVGLLGIPFAIMSSMGLPTNLYACLFTVSLLVMLCTISIFCLVAVSVDRYWAILHPMGYSRNVRTKTAIVIISVCWVTGSIIGLLPLLGWHKDAPTHGRCFFLDVMDYNYLVFLYFGTIITPALVLAAFYAHIYRVVLKQLRQIVTMNPESGSSSTGCASGGTMLRMLGAAQKREVKATQNLSIIVLFFMICWIPLYTINCILAFCRNCNVEPTFMFACIILSHLNSAGNPLLYAYHLRDFRAALKAFFCQLLGHAERPNPEARWTRKFPISAPPKIATIVKNSAALAAVTTGEVRDMWHLPEASSSESSQDKLMAIVRPLTPYHPRKTSDISQINKGYLIDTSSVDDDDDVFVDDTLPFAEFNTAEVMETNLADRVRQIRIVSSAEMYSSSPQLSRTVFLVEDSTPRKFVRSSSFNWDKRRHFRIFRSNNVGRSLSDDGTISSESIERKNNGVVVRSSCS